MQKLLDFLKKTFLDTRGVPDGKYMTLFLFASLCGLQFPIGWIWGRWAPDHIYYPAMGMLASGLGFATWETRSKMRNEAELAKAGVDPLSVPNDQEPAC